MKYFYKLLFITLVMPLFSTAQSNYKPGFVVNLKGDTIKGFVDYQEWNTNPGAINFKTGINDSKDARFTTQDINAFTVSGLESYQLYIGSITMDSVDPDRVSEGRDTSSKAGSFFLKVLQKGNNLTLYAYSDGLKDRFFIRENTSPIITELLFRTYLDPYKASGTGTTVNEDTYLKQLYALAQKHNAVNDDFQWLVQNASYDKLSILKIVGKINGMSDSELSSKNAMEGKVKIFAGIALNAATTRPYGGYRIAGGKTYISFLPALSTGINFFANPNTGKLIFRLEIMLNKSQYKSAYVDAVEPHDMVNYSYSLTEIALAPQVIYNFYNAEKFKVFAGAGFAFTHFSYSNAVFSSTGGTVSGANTEIVYPFDFGSFSTIIMYKAGVQFNKKWTVFLNYLSKTGNSQDPYFQLDATSVQLGINYNF